jgi:MoxR-like ATPase
MPSDITGVSVYDPKERTFLFKEGPVFNNLILADEINRATPKTQSALLEAMAENKVSVDGKTYSLPEPFFVIATQNPVEQYGTFPLPESQRDRFTMRLSLGYPDREVEKDILMGVNPQESIQDIRTLSRREEILQAQREVSGIFVSEQVADFLVEIGRRTRLHKDVILGVSTRGLIHTINAAKALAYIRERDFVVPEDILEVAPYTISHRVILREDIQPESVIREILQEVPAPR